MLIAIKILKLGDTLNIATPSQGTVGVAQLSTTGVSAGKFISETAGISTNTSVGINTATVDDNDLTGIGNSFKGLYIGNGMVIHDNELTGAHYIGTNFRGMMQGQCRLLEH